MRPTTAALAAMAALALAGCQAASPDDAISRPAHAAAANLLLNLRGAPAGPILLTTLVDIDRMDAPGFADHSSTAARVVSEHLATRLSQGGYRVVDARVAQVATVARDGVFKLSSDALKVAREHGARSVLVGTYGNVGGRTYVSVRLVAPDGSGAVLAADDFFVDLPRPAQAARPARHPEMLVIDRYGERTVVVGSPGL